VKEIEYLGEVMEDGHLTLPESVRKQLDLQPTALVRVTIAVPETDRVDVQEAWKLFQQMGRDAVPGRLPNASTNHDRYLYGRDSS
jgi:hypothetical protein